MTKLDGWWLVWGFNSSDKTGLKSWHLRKIKWPTILFIWPRRGGPPGRRTNRPTWPAQGCQTAQSAHAATTPWRRQLHTSFHLDCRIFCRVLKANYTYANTLLCVHWIGGKLSIAEKTAKNLSGILFCRTRLLINAINQLWRYQPSSGSLKKSETRGSLASAINWTTHSWIGSLFLSNQPWML